MELVGRLIDNLKGAVRSAQRLRGKPVYPATLQFWDDLLATAHQTLATIIDEDSAKVRVLAEQFEDLLESFKEARNRA